MKKIFFLIYISFFSTLQAQEKTRFAKIDSLLTFLSTNNKFMGQVCLREGDKIVFQKAYGFADAETNKMASDKTKYKVGSISKTFTAVMIMQLIEERKLKLETKLAKFYPQIENANKITIHNLLHHRTGIKDYLNNEDLPNPSKPIIKEEMINKIAAFKSLFEPNSKYEYSNSNYYLLGRIIEDVTKKDFQTNLQNRIIAKVPLQNTNISSKADLANNESYSYNILDNKWAKTNEWDMSLTLGAGNITSNADDLTKFFNALFEGRLVKKESLAEMTQLQQSYGKGLMTLPFAQRKFYGHTGGIEGFRSVVGYYPAEKFGVSLIVNGDNFNRNDIMIGILSIYYKMPYQFPNIISVKVKPEVLNSYIGVYSSTQLPIKIEIRNKNGEMEAQGTGQKSFMLNAINEKTFVFDQAGIRLIFENNKMTLKQGGAEYRFTKN